MTWTQAACPEVGAQRQLRTKAWHLEWSSDEELLEWAGETAQLHAEGNLFVIEMKIREEETVEEEHACSDDEPDDAASDPESVYEAAAKPPPPPPPTSLPSQSHQKDPEDPEVKRRHEILERCIALRLVYGCGPPGVC